MYKQRIKKLVGLLKKEKAQAFITFSKSNIFYLTGSILDSILMVSTEGTFLFVSSLYYTEAKKEFALTDIKVIKPKTSYRNDLVKILKKSKVSSLIVDKNSLSFAGYENLKATTDKNSLELVVANGLVEQLRAIKSRSEVAKIKAATKITSECFCELADFIIPGISEKDVRLFIETYLKKQGDISMAFDPIVASGKTLAQPHYTACNKKIANNDAVLVDIGAKYFGYCSDLTKMFMPANPSKVLMNIRDIVLKAKDNAINKIVPGVKASVVDKAARSFIEKKGYGKYFVHSTGHGLGIDVHEFPAISGTSDIELKPGMVITVEPAIYLPGKFGFREENLILVTAKGHEVLG